MLTQYYQLILRSGRRNIRPLPCATCYCAFQHRSSRYGSAWPSWYAHAMRHPHLLSSWTPEPNRHPPLPQPLLPHPPPQLRSHRRQRLPRHLLQLNHQHPRCLQPNPPLLRRHRLQPQRPRLLPSPLQPPVQRPRLQPRSRPYRRPRPLPQRLRPRLRPHPRHPLLRLRFLLRCGKRVLHALLLPPLPFHPYLPLPPLLRRHPRPRFRE